MYKIILITALLGLLGVFAKPLTELKVGEFKIDTDHVECKSSAEIIDECGLQQGFSYRFNEFSYPLNHTYLMSSCKRQADAFKCLRAYSKCLPPLAKQVLLAMVGSRQKYNKKLCTDKPSETALKVMEMTQCILDNKNLLEKADQAELNAIVAPEAIVNAKLDSLQDRLKHSCCSVARARREFMDTTMPNCKQYSNVASEMIDSYLAETVGIICPDFEGKTKNECDKLVKLNTAKTSASKHFVMPILNVIQTLA